MVAEILWMEIQFWPICDLPSSRKIGAEVQSGTIFLAAHTFSQVEMQISVPLVKTAVNLHFPRVCLSRLRSELEYGFSARLLIAADLFRSGFVGMKRFRPDEPVVTSAITNLEKLSADVPGGKGHGTPDAGKVIAADHPRARTIFCFKFLFLQWYRLHFDQHIIAIHLKKELVLWRVRWRDRSPASVLDSLDERIQIVKFWFGEILVLQCIDVSRPLCVSLNKKGNNALAVAEGPKLLATAVRRFRGRFTEKRQHYV